MQSVEHTSSCTPQRRGEGRGRVERRGERGEKERRREGEGGRGGGVTKRWTEERGRKGKKERGEWREREGDNRKAGRLTNDETIVIYYCM